MEGKACLFLGLAHALPQKHTVLSGRIVSPRVDDEDFPRRPEQEPKEKPIEEIRILPSGVQSLFLPTSL